MTVSEIRDKLILMGCKPEYLDSLLVLRVEEVPEGATHYRPDGREWYKAPRDAATKWVYWEGFSGRWVSSMIEPHILVPLLIPIEDVPCEAAAGSAARSTPSRAFPHAGYERQHDVFRDAHDQAAYGKGNERHANELPFHEQRMQTISQGLNSPAGMAYQVVKKIQEGLDMPDAGARRRELLGALNYLAGIVIFLDDRLGESSSVCPDCMGVGYLRNDPRDPFPCPGCCVKRKAGGDV